MSIKRREFVASVLASGIPAPVFAKGDQSHNPISGPLANATVTGGSSIAWAAPADPTIVPRTATS